MQAHTKKRRINHATVRITHPNGGRSWPIPLSAVERVSKFVSEVARGEKSVSSDDVFRDLYAKTSKPATVVRGLRTREGLTQAELAKKLGIPQGNLSQIESGKRPIGKETAKRLAAALNADYRVFL